MKVEEEEERQIARQQARDRVLVNFERLQSGASSTTNIPGSVDSSKRIQDGDGTASTYPVDPLNSGRGAKRKFMLDDDQVAKLANEQEEQALLQIEREQTEKRKAKLPNFWLVRIQPCKNEIISAA